MIAITTNSSTSVKPRSADRLMFTEATQSHSICLCRCANGLLSRYLVRRLFHECLEDRPLAFIGDLRGTNVPAEPIAVLLRDQAVGLDSTSDRSEFSDSAKIA